MRITLRYVVTIWTIMMFALLVYYIYKPFALLVTTTLVTPELVTALMKANALNVGLLWLLIVAPSLALYAVWPETA